MADRLSEALAGWAAQVLPSGDSLPLGALGFVLCAAVALLVRR